MTLGVTGYRTTIVTELLRLVDETVVSVGRSAADDVVLDLAADFDVNKIPRDVDRWVLASGLLYPLRLKDQTFAETAASIAVNLTSVVRICEYLLDVNPRVRIAILGSESWRGSFDTTYFLSKVGVNAYVQHRRLEHPAQQIVVISPTIIMDSGMTQRRHDLDRVATRAAAGPKGRLLNAAEVARLVHFVLYQDDGALTNVVLSMNAGEFA